MANILLVEPAYKTKFPPIGLLRLSSYYKARGDSVSFTRGCDPVFRTLRWDKVFISSLFTYELKRTIDTIKYYSNTVASSSDIIVGGVGATLLPDYLKEHVSCRIIEGVLDKPGIIDDEKIPIALYPPDYTIISDSRWKYLPKDSYFCRVTLGCIRRCKFCAVPIIEPNFCKIQSLKEQIETVKHLYGEKQNLVIFDNNILASPDFAMIIEEIASLGFHKNSTRNKKQRTVDFNQGIDARLIDEEKAKLLSTICVSPIRLALDHSKDIPSYVKAVRILANFGHSEFTNYVMYNFDDDPRDFYKRIELNAKLSTELSIRITSFPMKYTPINDTNRKFVSDGWTWKMLRGIQCILLATHGLVSPNLEFFQAAFGKTPEEFLSIISMPDRYIIFRETYKVSEAVSWRERFEKLAVHEKNEIYNILFKLNGSRDKLEIINQHPAYADLLDLYYPDGKVVHYS